jgi:DnaK suppressor protein
MTDRTDIDLEAFKRRLQERKAELENVSESADEARRPVELDQTRQGRLSRMDALQGQEMSKAAERRRQLELKRIESAFQRMKEGEYGYCVSCGDEIALKRLEADPTTPLCIDCAEDAGR